MESLQNRIAEIHSYISDPRSPISGDCLLDALNVLYIDCKKTQKKSNAIQQFIDKYKDIVNEVNKKNVNASDFDIKRFIQQGNFGDVYLVEEKHSCNTYVMKKVVREKISSTTERDIMVESKSPFIVNLFYAFQDTSYVYFVMEYVTGGDFVTLIENQSCGYLSESKTKFYIHELVQAVKYLHDLGYAHRDIKPDNMLLSATGHLKLTDFGSATKVNRKGRINSIVPVGTPEYVAPEILEWMEGNPGSDGYTQACDLWSIGVVAYELLTGNTPFNHDTLDMTYSSILACNTDEFVSFPCSIEVSSDMIQFVQGLIQKVDTRISMNEVLLHSVFNKLDSEPPCIPPPSLNNRYYKKEDKRKRSPNTNGFKTEQKHTEIALPLVGISYTGDTFQPNTTTPIEDVRNFKRENLTLTQQLAECKQTIDSYKKNFHDLKHKENEILDKCKIAADKYRTTCEQYESKLVDMKCTQQQLEQRLESFKVENSSLTHEVKQLKSMMDAGETKIRRDARKSQQFTNTQVDTKIDELVNKWKSEIKTKDYEIEQLHKVLEDERMARRNLEVTSTQDEELIQENKQQKRKIDDLTNELEDVKHKLKRIQNEKQLLQEEQTISEKEREKEVKDSKNKDKNIERLQKELIEKESKIKDLENDVLIIKKDFADVKEKLDQVKQNENTDDKKIETSELNKMIEELREKYEDEKKWARDTRLECYRTEKELKEVKMNLQLSETSNSTLKEKIEFLENQVVEYKDKCASLEKTIKEKKEEVDNLNRIVEKHKKTIEQMEASVKEAEKTKEKYEKDKKVLLEAKSAKERLEMQVRKYKVDVDANKDDLERYKNESIDLKAKVQKLAFENETSLKCIKDMDKQMDQFTQFLEVARDENDKLKTEVSKLKEEKSQIWHQCKTTEHNLKVLKNSFDDMKATFAEKETKLNSADKIIAEYEDKIETLQSTISKSESYCKDAMEYMEKLQKTNDILTHDNEQLRKERTEHITQFSNASKQNETLIKSNEGMIQRITELEHTIKSLEQFYKQKEIRLETTVDQLMKLCEHQRMFNEQTLKKKPNLLRKIFGSDNNRDFDSKELEALLSQERSKAKDLAEKLYHTKAELDKILHRTTQHVNQSPPPEEDKENKAPSNKNKKSVSKSSVTSTVSSEYKRALSKVIHIGKEIQINTAVFLSETSVILGTRDGLFALHLNELGEAKSEPNQIFGVDQVHSITFIHQKDLAIFVVGPNRTLQKTNLRRVVTAADLHAVSSPSLELSPLSKLTGVYALSVSPCSNILAVASEGLLTIYRWKVVEFEELCNKKLETVAKCLHVISPHSIVFGNEHSFLTFDPVTSRQRVWLSSSEPVCSTKEARPIALLNISSNEYLACFNTGAIFVDSNGKPSRTEPLYWHYYPVHVVYRKPFLVIFNPNCITVIQISDNTLVRKSLSSTNSNSSQPDDRVIDIVKPKFLGETLCNKNVVLLADSALQVLKPDEMFSAQSLLPSEDGEELSLDSIEEELKRLEKHTSL